MFNPHRLKKLAKDRTFRLVAIVLIALIAIPEASVAIDLFVALDIMGAELFLIAIMVGIRMLPWWWLQETKRLVYRVDPYFFVPERNQLRRCPALVAHAVPLFIPACLAAALWWGSTQLEG